MSGGAQQLVFTMLVQVFIGGCMYLHTARNGDDPIVTGCCRYSAQSSSRQIHKLLGSILVAQSKYRKWVKMSWHFMQSANVRTAGDPVKLTGKSMSSYLDVFWGVWFKLDQAQVQHVLMTVLGKHHLKDTCICVKSLTDVFTYLARLDSSQ